MGTPLRRAEHLAALETRIVARQALRYTVGAVPSLGRPAHVRAGSGLNWFGGKLAVNQDDTCFLGLVDLVANSVDAIALPCDGAGLMVFDGKHGKAEKPDFECSVVANVGVEEVLLAFGSGSASRRETVAVVKPSAVGQGFEARTFSLPAFYSALRACVAFSGSELNLEGAVLLEGARIMLFQRGNGARGAGREPVNSTCEIGWPQLWAHLHDAQRTPSPELRSVVNYDLGAVGTVPLTFTDATLSPLGQVIYVASAEDSPDTYRDGEVVGSAVGYFSGDHVRWGWLLDEHGTCLTEKAEGIVMHPTLPQRGYLCMDPDDAAQPTQLCEVEFRGPWPWLV